MFSFRTCVAYVCVSMLQQIYILATCLPIFHRAYGFSGDIYSCYPFRGIFDHNFFLLFVPEEKKTVEWL